MSSSSLYLSQDSTVRYKKRKANFTFSEVHILLDEVRKNRHIVVGKFNSGVPTELKRRKWAEITDRVNEIGECDREVTEVIKKWSDLKCDTKRKIAALQCGSAVAHSSLSQPELSPTECIVESILELDRKSWEAARPARSRSRDDHDAGAGDEDDDGVFLGASSVHSSPGPAVETRPVPSVTEAALGAFGMHYDISNVADADSRLLDSDDDRHDACPPSSSLSSVNNSYSEDSVALTSSVKHAASSANHTSSTNPAHVRQTPPPVDAESDCAREQLAQSASLSVQEQHATNALLASLSRSLELLAESAQQLAETQQEFARESLRLQRETVQVLRDFASGALTLLHERANGKPPLL